MVWLQCVFWASAGLIGWTHLGYPLSVAGFTRLRPRPVRRGTVTPTVTLVVTAHDEANGIAATIGTMLALDYPPERLEVVVASDGSSDGTDEIVERLAAEHPGRVSLLRCPRGGKVRAQDRAVRETAAGGGAAPSEIVAFADANGEWEAGALRTLMENFADPDVAYACGKLRLRGADGTNREGLYWRYELWLRGNEARIGSVTAGNGGIYAVRRADYLESPDGRRGHDLGLPYRLVQRGRRAVADANAVSWESPATDTEDEYRRKVRMAARCWQHVAYGRMLRGGGALFLFEMVSHRLLRYLSGVLHVLALASAGVLAGEGHVVYIVASAIQLGGLGLAACGARRIRVPGAGLAWYYLAITWATLAGLWRYLRVGVPVTWEPAEGTRTPAA